MFVEISETMLCFHKLNCSTFIYPPSEQCRKKFNHLFGSNLEQKSSVYLGIKGMSSFTRVVVDEDSATLILEDSIFIFSSLYPMRKNCFP
jgi:hypothetical protein